MIFKPGMRVRIRKGADCTPACEAYRGAEATILGPSGWRGEWRLDLITPRGRNVIAPEVFLEPLTDPDSEWADNAVKSLIRQVQADKVLPPTPVPFGD